MTPTESISDAVVPEKQMQSDRTHKRLFVHAIFAAVMMILIAAFYPLGRPVDETMSLGFSVSYCWVATEAFSLTIGTYLICVLITRWLPRTAFWIGNLCLLVLPVLCILDCIMFHMVGERFLSLVTARIMISLLPGLLPYLGLGSIAAAVLAIVAIFVMTAVVAKSSRLIDRHWSVDRPQDIHPSVFAVVLLAALVLFSIPAWSKWNRTLDEMANASVRHPWCMLRLVDYRGVGIRELTGKAAIRSQLEGLQLYDPVKRQVDRFNDVSLTDQTLSRLQTEDSVSQLPDIVVVVIESLRDEAVTDASMPNLTTFMRDGRRLPNHFSGGNSTNRGMFALANGIEGIWFDQSPHFPPLMNKLFRQAGYQMGFFGSSSGWEDFQMESFISPLQFDAF